MFKVKATVTNTRPAKEKVACVTTTPTNGNCRMSQDAALMIGVSKGDYVQAVIGDYKGQDAIYLVKGKPGDGENTPVGAKLATASGKDSGSLIFSSANVYNMLGGNKSNTRTFIVDGEGKQTGEDGRVYFPLVFRNEEAKQARKEKAVTA